MTAYLKKIFFVFVLGILIFVTIGVKEIFFPKFQDKDSTITINIERGANVSQIAKELKSVGLINDPKWLKLYSKISGSDTKFKSGLYKIKSGQNIANIVEYLTTNNQEIYYNPNKISIPEGLSLEQIEEIFILANLATKEEIERVFYDQTFIKDHLGFEAESLEGFIYPKTYYYEDNLTLKEFLVKYPLAEFKKEYASFFNTDSFYNNLILASIVEKESGSAEEKPIVASVFKNRLRKNMLLSSCATHNKIFYSRGKTPPKILLNVHLDIDSPYNTYKHKGLPPTPICSPSKESFLAVVSNVDTDYLYFFADFKGNNIFSVTYKEHTNKKKSTWQGDNLR